MNNQPRKEIIMNYKQRRLNNELRVIFCNIQNIKSNYLYVKELMKNYDIIFLCETWVPNNERTLITDLANNEFTAKINSTIDHRPSNGRSYGGSCWLIHNSINLIEFEIKNERVSAINVSFNNKTIQIIGTHMPYDDGEYSSYDEYDTNLRLIENEITSDSNLFTIIGGDFNGDLWRNNNCDKRLIDFIKKKEINPVSSLLIQNHDYTYISTKNNSKHIIDHVFITSKEMSSICNVQSNIINNILNNSDHRSVDVIVTIKGVQNNNTQRSDSIQIKPVTREMKIRPDLNNEEVAEQFCRLVSDKLSQPSVIAATTRDEIKTEIEKVYKNITSAIKSTWDEMTRIKEVRSKKTNWWNKDLSNVKSKIMALKHRCKSKKIIRNGNRRLEEQKEILDSNRIELEFKLNEDEEIELKKLKKEFKQLQRLSLNNKNIDKFNYIESIMQESNRSEFWKKIKKFNENLSGKSIVDIPMHALNEHFTNILNVRYDNLTSMQQNIINEVKMNKEKWDDVEVKFNEFNIQEIKVGIKNTSNSKAIGIEGISPFMLKKAVSLKLLINLKYLFNSIMRIRHFPCDFNMSIIRPIVKNNQKSNKDIANLRPISISNATSQLFEKLILERNRYNLKTHSNQFGFKLKSSCALALFAIQETITNYVDNGSGCFMVSLDAEKAFDRLWRDGLFHKLQNKIDLNEWLTIVEYYKTSTSIIENNNEKSETIKINCGVKQGGILSPFLFNFFINDLIEDCIHNEIGARVNNFNTSVIGYCDDLNILSSNEKQLQVLIDKCAMFGMDWMIKFNPLKSNIIKFGRTTTSDFKFSMNGTNLIFKDEIKVLGYYLNSRSIAYDNKLIKASEIKVKNAFFSLFNFGMQRNGLQPKSQAFILKTFCLSKANYAIEIASINKSTIKKINTIHNNLLRYLLGLNRYSRVSDIKQILKINDYAAQVLSLKTNFIKQLKSNELTSAIYDYLEKTLLKTKNNSCSFLKNLKKLTESYNIDLNEVVNLSKEQVKVFYYSKFEKITENNETIKELLDNYAGNYYNQKQLKQLTYVTFNMSEENFNSNLFDYS